jgi:serine/threonine protein kinase/Flp pilus assembly protein TadD
LRANVEALLKGHYEGESLLDKPVLGPDVTMGDTSLTEGPGTRIGRYKLLEMIGEGGFGVVYMAEQEKPIRRRVALKIIKLGMDTKQVIARFEAERQALAMMEHHNIAKVLDAGATETGRPYFVMELVKGIPITEYCDKKNLTTQQRLELFIDVCRAVQHAHQKGIIHRDIKPSNVMITLHDGRPVPKIIDFGIAKATQARLTEKTLFTEYKRFIGTPAYMSPEQAEMSGLDVDTRSDVYSLGVLLYELLTGSTPLEAKKLRSAAYDEMCRMIREADAPKPSTRLSTLGDELTEVAKHRDAQPGELFKIVRGDLDWIVMKTLEKERTRRYETVNELAIDIERHLKDEPVVAGPPSTGYRLSKFVRRNRTAVSVVLVVMAALLIGLCLAMAGFLKASRERNRADVNFQRAREAVDEMTRVAEEELANIPGVDHVRKELLQEAQVFYAGFLEENSDEAAVREQAGLAYKRLGRIHGALSNDKESEQAYRQAINVFEKLAEDFPEGGRHQMNIVHTMDNWARALEALGRDTEADEIRSARPEKVKGLVRRFPHNSLYRKMFVAECQGQESQQSYEEAIAWFEDVLAGHPLCRHELAMLIMHFGTFLKEEGRLEEAEKAFREAIAGYSKVIELDPGNWKAWCWRGYAYESLGQQERAIAHYLRATELEPEGDCRDFDIFAWKLATGPEQVRNPALAVEVAKRSVEGCPGEHGSWASLGLAYYRNGQYEEALEALLKSVELGPSGQEHTLKMLHLAMTYHELGQAEEARQRYDRAVEWMKEENEHYHDNLNRFRAEVEELLGMAPQADPNEEEVLPEKTDDGGQ